MNHKINSYQSFIIEQFYNEAFIMMKYSDQAGITSIESKEEEHMPLALDFQVYGRSQRKLLMKASIADKSLYDKQIKLLHESAHKLFNEFLKRLEDLPVLEQINFYEKELKAISNALNLYQITNVFDLNSQKGRLIIVGNIQIDEVKNIQKLIQYRLECLDKISIVLVNYTKLFYTKR